MSTRKVAPSAVVSPIARTSAVAKPLGRVELGCGAALVDEQHVDVRCVRKLAPAEAPETDDRKGHGGLQRTQCGFHARVGQRGELTPDRLQFREPDEVARADAEHLTPLEAPESGPAPLVVAPVERLECSLDELVARRFRGHELVVGEQINHFGMAMQRETEDSGGSEDATGALRRDRCLAEPARKSR